MRKGAGESGQSNDTGALLKEQNQLCWTIHRQHMDCQIFLSDFLYVWIS